MGTVRSWALALLGALLIIASVTPAAQAITATTASLTMTSDEGDPIGQGLSYSYSTDSGDAFDSSSWATAYVVVIAVRGHNGDEWNFYFAAPDGQTLAPGTYSGATRFIPGQPSGEPGLSIAGNSYGCNTLTGSFTVLDISFGPYDYLERFHATFEQHCEGVDPALRGEISILNPPAPEPLQLVVGVDPVGTVNPVVAGTATVHGTAWCNRSATVNLSVTLTQRAATRSQIANGSFFISFDCTGTVAWNATVSSESGGSFNAGRAQVRATLWGFDDATSQDVISIQEGFVRLTGT